MSYAKEMLDAAPTAVPLGAGDVAAAIDACSNAAQACTSCADSDLAEEDVASLRRCIALDADCADVCTVTARILSRSTAPDHIVLHRLLQACVRACELCAEECARHAEHHRHCAICAKACRACVQACTELLETEAFIELQKLAGG
jgi:uncharacterized membrane protein